METNTEQADIICIYCTAPLYVDDGGDLVDDDGFLTCPDSAQHRPVLAVEAIA